MADLQVFPDMFTRREVQSFVVHCTFMDDGCSWKGEIRNLEVSIVITKNEVKLRNQVWLLHVIDNFIKLLLSVKMCMQSELVVVSPA